ncbi:hypothetical protein [Paracoccus lutimaris]|uniref:hypothetical protein n=1 Tax=Paracoccus lutimaris TaxID=1490030 RepID=UPI0011C05B12|nr:hypothetical protein [Paracoccus lutimaris]
MARLLARAISRGEGASLLRFGDTGGRILARPRPDTPAWAYLQAFLGRDITPDQVEWLGQRIEDAAMKADIVGLRSDLLGPPLPDDVLSLPDDQIVPRLISLYPIRNYERGALNPDDARRLAETRLAMQRFRFNKHAALTNAWAHVDLAENGFIAALLKESRSVALITSSTRKGVVTRLNQKMNGRLRYYECPAYPNRERLCGGDHGFIWDRWRLLLDKVAPAYPGEPLLISAGIWTKPIAISSAQRGSVALDFGSVLDYFDDAATRPAVLADRYGDAKAVPRELTLDGQFSRGETLADFT